MIVPYDYQAYAVKCLFDFFTRNPDPLKNPVVALPTGTGKSVVIAEFLKQAFAMFPQQKVLIATHVKQLIQQNHAEFLGMWPGAPAGIYSAGLKRKDQLYPIIFCGIASIVKNIVAFGKVDLLIIDECHLLSQEEESMYQRVIAALRLVNPYVRIIGLTATPWRAGQGHITEDGIFTDICFNATDMESFVWFVNNGYLAPLVSKPTKTILDVSGVGTQSGDYKKKELELAVNKDEITYAAIKEAIAVSSDRKHWLVFCAGIDHVEKTTEILNYLGISACCMHSKMNQTESDQNLLDWKSGKYRAMVNNGMLTTGVNFRAIDLIIMLRPTKSTVLWVQMLGRGTRTSRETGKNNCMVLDFAKNITTLGPINDPVIPRKRGEKTGEVPIKICEHCGNYNHISARFCGGKEGINDEGCGMAFSFKVGISAGASTAAIIREVQTEDPIVADYKVEHVTYKIHQKKNKPDSLKVTYYCGVQSFSEYVLFDHGGSLTAKAHAWWNERTRNPVPKNTQDAKNRFEELAAPATIKVWVNALPFPKILQTQFDDSVVLSGVKTPTNVDEDDDIPF